MTSEPTAGPAFPATPAPMPGSASGVETPQPCPKLPALLSVPPAAADDDDDGVELTAVVSAEQVQAAAVAAATAAGSSPEIRAAAARSRIKSRGKRRATEVEQNRDLVVAMVRGWGNEPLQLHT